MEVKKIEVPTGHIFCTTRSEKPLEFTSIGDYGKGVNIKADFLGYTDELNGVPHGELLPLEEKWVITISTQHGCAMHCIFCDAPLVGKGKNVSYEDLIWQVETAMASHPEVTHGRLNLHFARMGEPTFNPNVIPATHYLEKSLARKGFTFHPVVSTMLPKANKNLSEFIRSWLEHKQRCSGDTGLQLSINSTSDAARDRMFSGNSLSLSEISFMLDSMKLKSLRSGRKITLNFALTGDEISGERLRYLFDPAYFMCKLTPMHQTATGDANGINHDGYHEFTPYRAVEEDLKNNGFDVLVFVPSDEEDASKITCGNVLLAGDSI